MNQVIQKAKLGLLVSSLVVAMGVTGMAWGGECKVTLNLKSTGSGMWTKPVLVSSIYSVQLKEGDQIFKKLVIKDGADICVDPKKALAGIPVEVTIPDCDGNSYGVAMNWTAVASCEQKAASNDGGWIVPVLAGTKGACIVNKGVAKASEDITVAGNAYGLTNDHYGTLKLFSFCK